MCHWVARSEAAFHHLVGLARLAETPSGARRRKQRAHQAIRVSCSSPSPMNAREVVSRRGPRPFRLTVFQRPAGALGLYRFVSSARIKLSLTGQASHLPFWRRMIGWSLCEDLGSRRTRSRAACPHRITRYRSFAAELDDSDQALRCSKISRCARKLRNLIGRFGGAFNQAEVRRRKEPQYRPRLAQHRGD